MRNPRHRRTSSRDTIVPGRVSLQDTERTGQRLRRRSSSSKDREVEELTAGGTIVLRNPVCPSCKGVIKNPKQGSGRRSGCGAGVSITRTNPLDTPIERDLSGFYDVQNVRGAALPNPGHAEPFFESDNSGFYQQRVRVKPQVLNPKGENPRHRRRKMNPHTTNLSRSHCPGCGVTVLVPAGGGSCPGCGTVSQVA